MNRFARKKSKKIVKRARKIWLQFRQRRTDNLNNSDTLMGYRGETSLGNQAIDGPTVPNNNAQTPMGTLSTDGTGQAYPFI